MWGWIVAIAGAIWDGIQAAVDVIVAGLVWFVHVLKLFGAAAWDVAKFTWSNVLKPLGQWLDRVYQRLKVFIEKVWKPIHEWLTRISTLLRRIYDTYFRPVLSTIDALRKTLKLLELLHVDWAAKLDAELVKLEAKIAAPILKAIEVVNAIDSRIEAYILTVDNLFKGVTLVRSIARDWKAVANIQWNGMIHTLDPTTIKKVQGAEALRPVDDHLETLNALLDERDADTPVDVADALTRFDETLAA